MSNAALFAVLVLLPAVLMAAAQGFAVYEQGRRGRYIVQLEPGFELEAVMADHRRRFRVVVLLTWNSSAKGYTAVITKRHLPGVEADPRVRTVDRREADEFLLDG